jgi:hypothetical protein
VKVYIVVPAVAVLIAGFQLPVMFSIDVAGKTGAAEFWHKGPMGANVGVTCVATVTLKVAVVPHCPASGVKVYTVVPTVAVLIVAGFQVPVIFSIEVDGSVGATAF